MINCIIKGCDKPRKGRGKRCNTHQYRLERYGNAEAELVKPAVQPIKCLICDELFKPLTKSTKYCNKACYYISKFRDKKPCSINECTGKSQAHGLCSKHHARKYYYGDPTKPLIRAPKGSGYVGDGYRWIKVNGKKYPEHRYLMEKHIGREIKRGEVVHHKNHNRLDNRIQNLEVLERGAHTSMHNDERWCKKFENWKWSMKHSLDACVWCGRSDIKHSHHGHCVNCVSYIQWAEKKGWKTL